MSRVPQFAHASTPTPIPFTRIPDAVLLDPQITPVQLRIYAVIARRADRESASAFPSYATIAADANICRASAVNGVAALVALGYLAKQAQRSGQGDATSNLYTIWGEGSQIFVPGGQYTVSSSREVVQNFDHGSTNAVPPVVQNLHQGGANGAPEPDSKNQKQDNKTQENRVARVDTREALAAAAAPESELQALFTDFQENIGALTAIAKQVIGALAAEHSVGQVRKAIQEAVIYEKRSLGYVRRVLHAWQREGRADKRVLTPQSDSAKGESAAGTTAPESLPDLVWPPPELVSDLPDAPDLSDPAVAAWAAICARLPDLGRLRRTVTPVRLDGDVLTVSVADARTYSVLTNTQRHAVMFATQVVLGDAAKIHVEMVERETNGA